MPGLLNQHHRHQVPASQFRLPLSPPSPAAGTTPQQWFPTAAQAGVYNTVPGTAATHQHVLGYNSSTGGRGLEKIKNKVSNIAYFGVFIFF